MLETLSRSSPVDKIMAAIERDGAEAVHRGAYWRVPVQL